MTKPGILLGKEDSVFIRNERCENCKWSTTPRREEDRKGEMLECHGWGPTATTLIMGFQLDESKNQVPVLQTWTNWPMVYPFEFCYHWKPRVGTAN